MAMVMAMVMRMMMLMMMIMISHVWILEQITHLSVLVSGLNTELFLSVMFVNFYVTSRHFFQIQNGRLLVKY